MTKKKTSLFIGRWQPLHAGHRALIDTALAEGNKVAIAIRDTPLSPDNPYSPYERRQMIHAAYDGQVTTVVIPDFDEICYGRGVGYAFREIKLDKVTEAVSGTATRTAGGRVIWLTGNSGAGKTTLANELCQRMRAIKLDGNEMRDSISIGAGFSEEERLAHNERVARLARELSKQVDVIVAVIAPTPRIREAIEAIVRPIWVYIERTLPEREGYFYTPPETPDIIVNHDIMSIEQSVALVLRELVTR